MGEVKLYQGDCLELMKDIPDKSVDMILCDLPYGTTACKWDVVIPFDMLWECYHKVLRDNGVIVLHCQQPFTTHLIASNTQEFRYCWIWYKHYARGFLFAKTMPMRVTEDIAVFYKQQCTYNPQMTIGKYKNKGGNIGQTTGCYSKYNPVTYKNDMYYPQNILDFAGCPQGQALHPTQKPVELLEYLIKTYTNEGDTVLDNCMGSGSTGVAAVNTNRNFIGIELQPEYFQIAQERIEQAKNFPGTEYKKPTPSMAKRLF